MIIILVEIIIKALFKDYFMKKISLAAIALGAIFLPIASYAQIDSSGLETQLQGITGFINILIPFVIGLAVVFFIFGLFKYVTAGGDEEKIKAARNTIIWGVIIIAVMISVWGLVNFVVNSFGLDEGPQVEFPCVPYGQNTTC